MNPKTLSRQGSKDTIGKYITPSKSRHFDDYEILGKSDYKCSSVSTEQGSKSYSGLPISKYTGPISVPVTNPDNQRNIFSIPNENKKTVTFELNKTRDSDHRSVNQFSDEGSRRDRTTNSQRRDEQSRPTNSPQPSTRNYSSTNQLPQPISYLNNPKPVLASYSGYHLRSSIDSQNATHVEHFTSGDTSRSIVYTGGPYRIQTTDNTQGTALWYPLPIITTTTTTISRNNSVDRLSVERKSPRDVRLNNPLVYYNH